MQRPGDLYKSPVAQICRRAGIRQANYFNSIKKNAGMLPSEMRRRELQYEYSRLTKIDAYQTLNSEMLTAIIKR